MPSYSLFPLWAGSWVVTRYVVLMSALLLASTEAVAAVRLRAVVVNSGNASVELLYWDGKLDKRIGPGKAKKIVYPAFPETIPIRVNGNILCFPAKQPPRTFIDVGFVHGRFKLVIHSDLRLYLVPFDIPIGEVSIAISRLTQPEGWPISGTPDSLEFPRFC